MADDVLGRRREWLRALKPGTRITLTRADPYSEEIPATLVQYPARGYVGDDFLWVIATDDDDAFRTYNLQKYAVALDEGKKRRRLAVFRRSDGYEFVVWKRKGWNLRAGCRRLRGKTRKKLERKALWFWRAEHNTENREGEALDVRIALNKESRRGIKKVMRRLR